MRFRDIIDAVAEGRRFIIMLVIAGAAASLGVWWWSARSDRDSLIRAADGICEASGAPFRAGGVAKRQWGVDCLKRVRAMRATEDAVQNASLAAAITAMEERAGKEAVDAALAAEMAKRAAGAAERMEKADAEVEGDRVGGGWAAGLNNLGGLRQPGL